MTARPIRVSGCKAHTVRLVHKNKRVQVTYDVAIQSDAGQSEQRTLLATLPVTREFLSAELLESCRAARGHPAVVPFERLATFIPELRMGVQFFPVDVNLPAMMEATRGDSAALVAPFLTQGGDAGNILETRAVLMNYRPGVRCVLRFTATLLGPRRERRVRVIYGKIFADDRGAEICRDMQTLWQVSQRSDCLRTPEPLGYDPAHRMLILAEAPGERELHDWLSCLRRGGPLPSGVDQNRVERGMAVVARALAVIHGSGIHPREQRTFEGELADQHKSFGLIRNVPSALARQIERALQRLDACALNDEPLVPSHGGFRHRQLLGNEQNLTLLDWDGLTLAHPAWDAATFLRGLRWEAIAQPGKFNELERLAEVFRREFLFCHPTVDRQRLAAYEALLLTQGSLREVRHSWAGANVIGRLLAAAERLLDGGKAS